MKGCFDVVAFFEFYLEGPGTIFGNTCCSWDCAVSDVFWQLMFIVFVVVIMLSCNQHVSFLSNSYVLSFSLGAGPVPALLLPEIFSSRIRAKAVALSLGMHWVRNYLRKCFSLFFYLSYASFSHWISLCRDIISRVSLSFVGEHVDLLWCTCTLFGCLSTI